MDANKTRNIACPPPPQWHKRLCIQLTNAYANYIETNSLFSGFQSVNVNRSRSSSDRSVNLIIYLKISYVLSIRFVLN